MNDEPDETLEGFRRLLSSLPAGPGSSVELVISQLAPVELLRLAAVPHHVDRGVAAVLMPDAEPEALGALTADLLELSLVKSDGVSGSLHDETRGYLLGQWFDSRGSDPERWQRFREASARLARPDGERLQPVRLPAGEQLVAGLARDAELPAERRHRLALQPAGDEAQTFFHDRTLSPRHPHLPPRKGGKCNPCVRYVLSPMSPTAQGMTAYPGKP